MTSGLQADALDSAHVITSVANQCAQALVANHITGFDLQCHKTLLEIDMNSRGAWQGFQTTLDSPDTERAHHAVDGDLDPCSAIAAPGGSERQSGRKTDAGCQAWD